MRWFNSISHLVEHSYLETKKIILGADEQRFISYINTNWLVPPCCSGKELKRYKIYKEADKEEIVNVAYDCKLFNMPRSLVTFNRVIRMLSDSLGYEVETGRIVDNKICYTYKLIVSFDKKK